MTSAPEKPRPLEGLKVLDFSRVLAGPYAGRMLSDLGAEVVKIEPPDGDMTRLWGKMAGGQSAYYVQHNVGKRNVSIDLRAPKGRDLVLQLARHADIVIENYRPDVMGRLGLGYEALSAENPRLIMLSISGFGRNGPESSRPAYAPIIHAETGALDRAFRVGDGPRRDLPLSVADTNAGLHGLVALLAALHLRERTGLGQHVDIAMIDAMVATDDQFHYDLEDARASAPLPNDIWETGAGPILISSDFRWLWRQLGEAFDLKDPPGAGSDLDSKIRGRRETVARFLLDLKTFEAVDAVFRRMNMAWGRVRRAEELPDQPTLAARGAFVAVDDRAGSTRRVPQSPYRFSNARSGVAGPAPHRGEDNALILKRWLGLADAEIADLEAAKIIGADIPRL